MLGRRVRTGLMILMVLLVGGFLFAIPGFLTVEAIDGVRVLVDGKYEAVTVGGKTVVMLEPGSYLITLEKEGYSSTSQTKVIKASEATSLKVDMRKPEVRGEALDAGDTTVVLGQKTGTVEVRSVPFRDADIQINGVNYGKTDRRLSNMPVGQIQVQVTKDGKRVAGSFTVKENQTIQLQANYALNPAQIVQLYNATFMVPELPQGIKAELIGTYGSGYIESGKSTTVMGPKHKVKYTNGQEYIDFEQSIDLDESTQVRLTAPDTALFSKILPKYTVKFESGGGSAVLPMTNVVQDSKISASAVPTRSGYTFAGWYKDSALKRPWDFSTDRVVADVTLYAAWSPNTYTVSFESQGGSEPSTKSKGVVYEQSYGYMPTVIRAGYSFGGWWTEPNGRGKEVLSATTATITGNQTLYAKWGANTYTVSFDASGGRLTGSSTKQVRYQQAYGELPVTQREGYSFSGWWTAPNRGGMQILGTTTYNQTQDQRLYASWSANTYTVSFDSQGGSEPSIRSKSVVYEQGYGYLPVVARAGYSFDGWWTEPSGKGKKILSSTTATTTGFQTLYAKWYKLYQIGDIGPAGGYIFYDKGSYSDGWRYLEAAPASTEYSGKVWGGYGTDIGGTSTAIGTGKINTEKIVAKFGKAEPHEKKTDYAAKVCADLVVTKDGTVYEDWFLPSRDELDLMYQNLYRNNLGGFSDDNYWSSSEYNAYNAWYQYFNYVHQNIINRDLERRVRPVRAF